MIEVKSQLLPVRAESEAPVALSADTKTEDENSVCVKETTLHNRVAPIDELAMLVEQVVFPTMPKDVVPITYSG